MALTGTHANRGAHLLTPIISRTALGDALAAIGPRAQLRNPLTLGVYVGSGVAGLVALVAAVRGTDPAHPAALSLAIAAWLGATVLAVNFAAALIGRRGLARAARWRALRPHLHAKRLLGRKREDYHVVEAGALRRGDVVLVEAGDTIPADGTVIDGTASVSEAAVTGESAPVLRTARPETAPVRAGSQVLSDWLLVRVRSREGFFDPIVTVPEAAWRLHTGPERALSLLLTGAALLFLLAPPAGMGTLSVLASSVLIALCIVPIPAATRILLAKMDTVGMDRLLRAHVIATSGASVEAAGLVDVMVLDKTGTITLGDRHAVAFHPVSGVPVPELVAVARLASLADETPEGRSIVALASSMRPQSDAAVPVTLEVIHRFSAHTGISGIDRDGRKLRKGAVHAVQRFVEDQGGRWPAEIGGLIDRLAASGTTPLVVAENARVLGVVELRDVVKGGIRECFAGLRQLGVRTVMVTGDHRLTAQGIAADIGVDDVLADATPMRKLSFIRERQRAGERVAMCGDGTNDAPALAQADVAVVMNTGTPMAKDVGGIVDLDSNPANLTEIVATGRQLLRARQSLTVFSASADFAKYLVVLGAVVAAGAPQFQDLNLLRLTDPYSALLAAVVFSALLVAVQTPLALRHVRDPSVGTARLPPRALAWTALAGMLVAAAGIKLIDAGLAFTHAL